MIPALAVQALVVLVGGWLVWQLLRQNGRILLQLDDIEERLHALEFSEVDEFANASAPEEAPAKRFGNPSLAHSKINRSGLKAGTRAPEVHKLHREHPETAILTVSAGQPQDNRAKVKEHRFTVPVVLQQPWETARRYAMFDTPIAHRIDGREIIAQDAAVAVDQMQAT